MGPRASTAAAATQPASQPAGRREQRACRIKLKAWNACKVTNARLTQAKEFAGQLLVVGELLEITIHGVHAGAR
jgi:hypothetical protein